MILATVLAAAELMFVSNHDALMVSAIVLAAALVALRAAHVASAGVVEEVADFRDALRAVGTGERDQRVHGGPPRRSSRELAEAANSMIEQLARRSAAATPPTPRAAISSPRSPTTCARRSPRCG